MLKESKQVHSSSLGGSWGWPNEFGSKGKNLHTLRAEWARTNTLQCGTNGWSRGCLGRKQIPQSRSPSSKCRTGSCQP